MKLHALAWLVGAAVIPAAYAGVIDKAQRADTQTWSAWGGNVGFHWNQDLLRGLGITLSSPDQSITAPRTGTHADFRQNTWFEIRPAAGVDFTVRNGGLQTFEGGALAMRGGYTMRLRDGTTIDLRNVTLRVRDSDHGILDFVGSDGKAWFYTDRMMFELVDGNRTLAIRVADIRVSPELANRVGVPEAANWGIGGLVMNTEVNVDTSRYTPDRVCSPYPWPGVAVPGVSGQNYQADLFMQTFDVSPVGCQNCDGPGGNDGIVGMAPSSTLRNNVNDGSAQATISGDPLGTSSALYTANVAWYTMFSGNHAPYSNDQHPFLIWNMYRIAADGTIEQIGRSGVKHAFLTINASCLDNCNDSHSLGRGCGDTYSEFNNDSSSDMGPRSEIVPAQGLWGRCGSIFDSGCTGSEHGNGNNEWTQRLQTHESQVDPAANAGASYWFESWYVARDDIDIYNSMATIAGTPHYAGGQWTLTGQTSYKLGPAIDRWVSPDAPPANSRNTELAAPEGHAKVAVKATDLGGGNWRYVYAVQNLDFARAIVETGDGTDPRVVSNKGFDSFSVPLPAGATVVSTSFSDGDLVTANNWLTTTNASAVTWRSGGPVVSPRVKRQSLDWGSMYTFTVVVNKAPATGNGTLHVATAGSPASYTVSSLVPGS